MAKAQEKPREKTPELPHADETADLIAKLAPDGEFAQKMFKAMRCELTPQMIAIYKEFKARKDRLTAGRLSPEGFAYVSLLADIVAGKFKAPGMQVND